MSETLRRPEQILGALSADRANLVEKAQTFIAAELEETFTGEPIDVFMDGSKRQWAAVLPHIQRIFNEAGWSIEISARSFSNQKDGDRTCFRVMPK